MVTRMISTVSKWIGFMMMMVLMSRFGVWGTVNAGDWEITADESLGLISKPKDQSDENHLFDVPRMMPGDIVRSTVTIKNNCSFPFTLTVEVKNPVSIPAGGVNLAEQLVYKAYRDGILLAGYPSGMGTYTFRNDFNPGSSSDIVFEAELPGESTGNEFQNQFTSLEWIFTANAGQQENPPPEEEEDDNGGEETDGPGDPGEPGEPVQTITLSLPVSNEDLGNADNGIPGDEIIVFGEDELPLGYAQTADPDGAGEEGGSDGDEQDETKTDMVEEDENPLGSVEMPKTGEASLWRSILPGSALVLFGVLLLAKEKRHSGERVK